MQLIMIEGLPGTGKSSITEWLGKRFSYCGQDAIPLFEGDDRIPCDFYCKAGIPLHIFYNICDENLNYSDELRKNALITKNYAYIKIDGYPENVTKLLSMWDMGDENNHSVTVKEYILCALERLNYWVESISPISNTLIIDSGFLQNPVNELLFRKATDKEVIFFIKEIFNAIKGLSPLCIYLCRNSAVEAINFAKKVKGKGWSDRVDDLLTQNAVPNLFQHRFDLEKQLLNYIPNITCKIIDDDWSSAKEQVKNHFLL